MNSTDDVKVSLRLFQLCFFLILYIHCTACALYYVTDFDRSWKPGQLAYYGDETDFYSMETFDKYGISFYNSILALTGNDIYPAT